MTTSRGTNSPLNPTIRAIAAADRREILTAVLERAPVTEQSLVDHLAARQTETTPPTDRQSNAARVNLVHVHLPKLRDAGLIAWDEDAGTVEPTTHPALSDERFRHLLRVESEGGDDVLEALSHEYRRIVLTALWEGETEQPVTTLARKVVHCRDRDGAPETDSVDDVEIQLHHIHLPKLADRGLVEYDSRAARVTYTGHPVLEEVLAIIYEPDGRLVDRYDGLLSGLLDSYRSSEPDRTRPDGWPHHWRGHHD